MTKLVQFGRDDSGVTAIEYALIASGISVAIASVVLTVGETLLSTFMSVEAAL
jgi:pilus assembly protein Flp/PilA